LGFRPTRFDLAGFPQLNFNGTIATRTTNALGERRSDINNRISFLDDITWIKGKHTIKAGIEIGIYLSQTGWP